MPFVFDNASIVPDKVGTGAERLALADVHERRVARLRANRQSAVRRASPPWPVYDSRAARDDGLRSLDSRVVDDPRGDERRLFEQVPYVQPGT